MQCQWTVSRSDPGLVSGLVSPSILDWEGINVQCMIQILHSGARPEMQKQEKGKKETQILIYQFSMDQQCKLTAQFACLEIE